MASGSAPSADYAAYDARRGRLRAQYAAIPAGAQVRLAKRTSNLFRQRSAAGGPGLDVRAFDGVLSVDPAARTADVQAMTTYEHLIAATLPYGLIPLVVPQLKTITIGGAVTGLGIESTSFRNGLPHESVLAAEVLTGDGRVLVATRDNEHADLFHGLPNSYGTLGYVLRLTIALEPVAPYVSLRHVPFDSAGDAATAIAQICRDRAYQGEPVDFCDGTLFEPHDIFLTLGRYADQAPHGVSDYTGRRIYYRSIGERHTDTLTMHDYLWRWDTDWFWCSGAFGVQNRWVRPLVPRRLLRSDTYWKIVAFESRHGWYAGYERRRGRPARERVIQDIEVPLSRLPEFLGWFDREIGMRPVWLCPLSAHDPPDDWPLYRMDHAEPWVNVGFWGTVALSPGQDVSHHNRLIEAEVERLGGRKSLYSSAFYEPDEFWRIYNGAAYELLKKKYDPDGRLLDLYDKAVRAR
ncbi:MAG TPA: FAD-binding oxidoreductase [Mycobacteriales bacterium]|nr:FAD-binding oxidoreductase [Mycobacteriales bacterium]